MNESYIYIQEVTSHFRNKTLYNFSQAGFNMLFQVFHLIPIKCLNIMSNCSKLLHSAYQIWKYKPQICKCNT